MANSSPKNFPAATSEVASMLNLNASADTHGSCEVSHGPDTVHATAPAPANLPQAESASESHDSVPEKSGDHGHGDVISQDIEAAKGGSGGGGKIIRTILPYALVFVIGLTLYFFFFKTINFSTLFKAAPKATTAKQTQLESIMKDNMAAYETWIRSYYYDVSDVSVLDANKDNSGNGLTNFQKFLLNLNPKSYDTLGLGMPDSQAIAQGINPLTGGKLTDSQKQIVDKYFDMEVIMNRFTLQQMQNNGQVAGANTTVEPQLEGLRANPYAQPVYNGGFGPTQTAPVADPTPTQPATTYRSPVMTGPAPANGINLDGATLDIDQTIPGRLEIPSLKINVPIMWSSDPKNFEKDLQSGVIHYPGTALPGQIGTAYISGHSSNYVWAKGNYNSVFSKLGDLADYTSFKITVVQKNGKDAVLYYVVKSRQEYKPDDQAQFMNSGVSTVALSTCWPVGTTQKRLVVFGELTQVVK